MRTLAVARVGVSDRRARCSRQARPEVLRVPIRHSWATRALQRSLDPLTVAILMGHSEPSMLAKVYQHVAHDPEYTRAAAERATGSGA